MKEEEDEYPTPLACVEVKYENMVCTNLKKSEVSLSRISEKFPEYAFSQHEIFLHSL
jgi:hypothetical protein